MEYRVELSARAERNLIHLYEQIRAEDSVRAARWFNRLEKAVYSLDGLPHRCPVAPESRRAKRSLRQLLYQSSELERPTPEAFRSGTPFSIRRFHRFLANFIHDNSRSGGRRVKALPTIALSDPETAR